MTFREALAHGTAGLTDPVPHFPFFEQACDVGRGQLTTAVGAHLHVFVVQLLKVQVSGTTRSIQT